MIRRSGAHVLVLGATLWVVACGREAPRAEVADETEVVVPVAAAAARRGSLRAVIRTTGVVTPAAGAEFIATASEPARILELPPAEGDRVARGDLIIRFEMPSADADASRQRAEIARTQARLENVRISHDRSRELLERGVISRREMESADRELSDAQAELARAESVRTASDAAMARALVYAPFAGVIAQRFHNAGDVLQGIATDPILRLIDPDRLEVTATIPAADAPRVLPGATARVTSVSSTAPIRLIVAARPASGGSGGDAIARLTFPEAANIAADTRVDIEIDGEEHVDVVLVPIDALIRQGNEVSVLIAAGRTARRRVVSTGLSDTDSVEITRGIEVGELVITRGQAGLSDGAAISIDVPAR